MKNWSDFWQDYRLIEIKSDKDLLYQVGLTVNGLPISEEQFKIIVEDGAEKLFLNGSDKLLDLCCGNGLITFELAKKAQAVTGVDVSRPFIENARKFKGADNIEYLVHDAKALSSLNLPDSAKFSKIFMYGCLAYFNAAEVGGIFQSFLKLLQNDGRIFIGNILDKDRMWNFYNTPRRKLNYFINHKILMKDPAVGTWWKKNELKNMADAHGFNIEFFDEDPKLHTAHYRFDCILTKK